MVVPFGSSTVTVPSSRMNIPEPSWPGWVRTWPAGASNSVTTAPMRASAPSSRSAKIGMARSFATRVSSMCTSLPAGLVREVRVRDGRSDARPRDLGGCLRERVPHRVRQHGRDPGRRLSLLGRADGAVAAPLLDRRSRLRTHAARGGARDGCAEEGRGHGEPRPTAASTPSSRDLIVAAADEVIDGKLDEHFPLFVWQTGSRHADQHERQRGHLQPRHRDGRR